MRPLLLGIREIGPAVPVALCSAVVGPLVKDLAPPASQGWSASRDKTLQIFGPFSRDCPSGTPEHGASTFFPGGLFGSLEGSELKTPSRALGLHLHLTGLIPPTLPTRPLPRVHASLLSATPRSCHHLRQETFNYDSGLWTLHSVRAGTPESKSLESRVTAVPKSYLPLRTLPCVEDQQNISHKTAAKYPYDPGKFGACKDSTLYDLKLHL